MDRNHYFFIGSVFKFSNKSKRSGMDKFRVFVYMLMKDVSLKQRILCMIHISIFGAFLREKSVHYSQVNTVSKINFTSTLPISSS